MEGPRKTPKGPLGTHFRPSAAAASGQHLCARPAGERIREPAADRVNGRALLRDARKDVAVRSAAQQQRGESACLIDPFVSFVDPFMPSRLSFVFFVSFVAVLP